MRFTKIIALAAFVAAAFFSVQSVHAQAVVDKNRSYFSPDQQFGIGFNSKGGTIQYALGPAFHIGLNLNLDFHKDSAASNTYYNFGPYAKFIFSGDVIKPYVYAALGLVQPNTGSATVGSTTAVDLPKAEVRIILAAGAEHFFNQNVGIYGHVNLVDAKLSPTPSTTEFGLQGAAVGVEFFF
ncbi:MAG: hypothetical protein ABI876_12335 [Bacteroidota bacterium]